MADSLPGWKDKALFTPGPLTTSRTVKQAMLRDLGSRDDAFIGLVAEVRAGLLEIAEADPGVWTAIPMQGSGTFAVESVFASAAPPDGKVLVAVNGAYGKRMLEICRRLRIDTVPVEGPEHLPVDPERIAGALRADPEIHTAAMVHCETTTGIMNALEPVGLAVRAAGARFVVDAMSSFGAVPIDLEGAHIDYLVSSANKCIEGVPGFGFVLARRSALEASRGWSRSLSLDLLAQLEGLETTGQFRFTPPTHALLAFHQALKELREEGGARGRLERYRRNHDIILAGLEALGFVPYLPASVQGPIITSFRYPADPAWDFETFYRLLNDRGFVIYPGKVSDADCFRIGNIGRLFPSDMHALTGAVREVLAAMGSGNGVNDREPAVRSDQ